MQKLQREIYTASTLPGSEHISLLEVSRKVPKGVIACFPLSVSMKLGLNSKRIWIAIDGKAWAPRISSPAVHIVRFSGPALHFGVQERQVGGGTIRVFSPAKTVADCFKYRHKIGIDVALEAPREAYRQKKTSINQLFEAARVCRVANVMKPYLESLP